MVAYEHYIEIDMDGTGRKIELNLWEANAHDDYHRLRPLAYPHSDVFLMCFSIDDQESLENVAEKWIHEVRHFCPDVPILLVGNKKDLREELLLSGWGQNQEPVTPEQGTAVAEKIGAYAYMECSAKTKEGVREVFETAARASLVKRCKRKKSRWCWNFRCSIL